MFYCMQTRLRSVSTHKTSHVFAALRISNLIFPRLILYDPPFPKVFSLEVMSENLKQDAVWKEAFGKDGRTI